MPSGERLPEWRRDYSAMREEMFYGEPPSFEEVLQVVKGFEEKFNLRV
jgi:hypothetical protein